MGQAGLLIAPWFGNGPGRLVTVALFCYADPSDYLGGTFDVTFGTAAGNTQCINIILISDNEREDVENFFVDVDLNDMGAIRAGNPSRTTVGIEGMQWAVELESKRYHIHTSMLTKLVSRDNQQIVETV
jgi:hypothetical protein